MMADEPVAPDAECGHRPLAARHELRCVLVKGHGGHHLLALVEQKGSAAGGLEDWEPGATYVVVKVPPGAEVLTPEGVKRAGEFVTVSPAVRRIERRMDLERRKLVEDQGVLVARARQLLDSLLEIRDSGEGSEAERADVARAVSEASKALERHLETYNNLRRGGPE